MASSLVTIFCRTCNAPRYQSIRALSEREKLDPRLFQPVDPEIPPASENDSACYLCKNIMTVLWHDKKTLPRNKAQSDLPSSLADAPPAPPARNSADELYRLSQEEQTVVKPVYTEDDPLPTPSHSSGGVETLFELRDDEELRSFEDRPDGWLIATTRRIVKVLK